MVGAVSRTPDERSRPLQPRAFIADFNAPDAAQDATNQKAKTWDAVGAQGRAFFRTIFRDARDRHAMKGMPGDRQMFLLGSEAEWRDDNPSASMASAATVCWDATASMLTIRTSITGLPPIFLYRAGPRTVVSSDLWLLSNRPAIDLAFDDESLWQVCHIGYPIGYRTLFRGITVLTGGSRIDVSHRGDVAEARTWRMPDAAPVDRWAEFTEIQVGAFRDAVRRMDVEGAFLSMTGGLDTRAILVAMLEAGRRLPAFTMSWKDISLDARRAAAVCRRCNIAHTIVGFDKSFAREIADRALTASRLSGGLAAVDQATEVAFYSRIGGSWRSRISGLLGNQVGRGGREHHSLRHGDGAMLSSICDKADAYRETVERVGDAGEAGFRADTFFATIGNYCVGHYFMTQASPYASRALIEAQSRRPVDGYIAYDSLIHSRLRDLRHRFMGEPLQRSFQRQLIVSGGGDVADEPINWGWLAAGGFTVAGLTQGALALVDAFASSRALRVTSRRTLDTLPGVIGRHDFRQPRLWWSRDLLHSVLLDQAIRESGVFVLPVLRRKLDEHFGGSRDHMVDLLLATDLAFAHRAFLEKRAS